MQATARLSSASKTAIIRVTKEGLRSKSNIQIRGKSNVSSVANEPFKPRKIYKRLSVQERRAIVISFIDKYRALNDGKIPGPGIIQREIGGGFYVIREIVQELLYKQKMSQGNEFDSIFTSVSVQNENEKVKHAIDAKEKENEKVESSVDATKKEKENIKHTVDTKEKENERIEDPVDAIEKENEKIKHTVDAMKKQRTGAKLDKVKKGEKDKLHNAKILQESAPKVEQKIRDEFDVKVGKDAKLDSAAILQESPAKIEQKINSEFEAKEGEKMKLECDEILQKSPPKLERKIRDESVKKESKNLKMGRGEILQESPTKVEQKMRDEFANSEPLEGKHKSEEKNEESSEPAGKIWGNLKSFADGIINFWKKF